MSATVAWGAPVFLPTGDSAAGDSAAPRVLTSWWERDADAEAAEAAARHDDEHSSPTGAGDQGSTAQPDIIVTSNVSAEAAAFFDTHKPSSIEQLYSGVAPPVEQEGLFDLQSMAAIGEQQVPHAHATKGHPMPHAVNTSTLTSFSSPASKQMYWLSSCGTALSIVNAQLELIATLSIPDALPEEQRLELVVNSAADDGEPASLETLRITALAANDEEQLVLAVGGCVFLFDLQLRNRSYTAPASDSSKPLLLDPAAAWDELDLAEGNVPRLNPSLPAEFRLRFVTRVEGLRRGAHVSALAFKSNNHARAYSLRDEAKDAADADAEDDEDDEQDPEEARDAVLAKLNARGGQQSAPLPLRLELLILSTLSGMLVLDACTFDQLRGGYVGLWSVEGQEDVEFKRRSEMYERVSGSGACDNEPVSAPPSSSSSLLRVAPDGRAVCLAPFGTASCNLYMLNLGNNGVLNVTAPSAAAVHAAALARSQYGAVPTPNNKPAAMQVGSVLEHAAPVLAFHFYSSTPSQMERASIPHPAVGSSVLSALNDPAHPSSLVSVGGTRRPIPSAAAPNVLAFDNLLVSLAADGSIRIWKQAPRHNTLHSQQANPFMLTNIVRGGIVVSAQISPALSAPRGEPQSAQGPGHKATGSLTHSVSVQDVAGMNANRNALAAPVGQRFLGVPGAAGTSRPPTHSASSSNLAAAHSHPALAPLSVDPASHAVLRTSGSNNSISSMRSPVEEAAQALMGGPEPLEELTNAEWFSTTEVEAAPLAPGVAASLLPMPRSRQNGFIGVSWVHEAVKHSLADAVPPNGIVSSTPTGAASSLGVLPVPAVCVPNYSWHNPRLLTLDREGQLTLWSVRDIYAQPRCNPAVLQMVAVRSDAASAPFSATTATPWLYSRAIAAPLLSSQDAVYSDTLLRLFALSETGQLTATEILARKEPHRGWIGSAKLVASLGGHQLALPPAETNEEDASSPPPPHLLAAGFVQSLRSHPALPLAASLGADGRIAVYSLPSAQLMQLSGESGERVKFLAHLCADASSSPLGYSAFVFYPYLLDHQRVLLFALGAGNTFMDVFQSQWMGHEGAYSAVQWTLVHHAVIDTETHRLSDAVPVNLHVLEPDPTTAFDANRAQMVHSPPPPTVGSHPTHAADVHVVVVLPCGVAVLAVPSKYHVHAPPASLPGSARPSLIRPGSHARAASEPPVETIKVLSKLSLPMCAPGSESRLASSGEDAECTASFMQRSSRNSAQHVLVYATSIGHVILTELTRVSSSSVAGESPSGLPPSRVVSFELAALNGFVAHAGRRILSLKNINGLNYLVTTTQAPPKSDDDAAVVNAFASFASTARKSNPLDTEFDIRVWSALGATGSDWKPCYDVRHVMPPSIVEDTSVRKNIGPAVTSVPGQRSMVHSSSHLSMGSRNNMSILSAASPRSAKDNAASRPVLPFVEPISGIGSGVPAFLTSDGTGTVWMHQPLNAKQLAARQTERARARGAAAAKGVEFESKEESFIGSESWDCSPHPRVFPENYALMTGVFNPITLGVLLVGATTGATGPATREGHKGLVHIPVTPVPLLRHIPLHPLFSSHRAPPPYHPAALIEDILSGQMNRVNNIIAFVMRSVEAYAAGAAQAETEDSAASGIIGTAAAKGFGVRAAGGAVSVGPVPFDLLLPDEDSTPFITTPGSFMSAEAVRSGAKPKPAVSAVDSGQVSFGGGGFGGFGGFGGGGFGGGGFGGGGFGGGSSSSGSSAAATVTPMTYKVPNPRQSLEFSDSTLTELIKLLSPSAASSGMVYSLSSLTPSEHVLLVRVLKALLMVREHAKHLDEFGKRFLFQAEMLALERAEWAVKIKADQEREAKQQDDEKLKADSSKGSPLDSLMLPSHVMALAFHSANADTLLSLVTAPASTGLAMAEDADTALSWSYVRSLGAGYWASLPDLEALLLKVARSQYLKNKSPNACWMLYLALRKKNVLLGLMKTLSKYAGVYELVSSDFENDEDAVAQASSNGMRVIERNAELAMGFFLLAAQGHKGSGPNQYLDLAVSIAFRRLKDPQLAVAICRVFEGEGSPTLRRMIDTQLLPQAIADSDIFLVYMALVVQGRKRDAVNVLVHGYRPAPSKEGDKAKDEAAAKRLALAPFPASSAAFLYLLHASAPALGAQRSLPHVERHIPSLQPLDLSMAQKRSAQAYAQRQLTMLALETFPREDVPVVPVLEEPEEPKTVASAADSAAAATAQAQASGQVSFGGFGGFGGGGFGQAAPAPKPAPAVDPAASGQFGGGGGFGGGFGSFGSFGGAPPAAAAPPVPKADPASGQLGGGFGSFGSFGSFGQSGAAATPAAAADPSASGQVSFASGGFGSFGQAAPAPAPAPKPAAPAAFNLASFGSFGGGGTPSAAASSASSSSSTAAPDAASSFPLVPALSRCLPASELPVAAAQAESFSAKVRYAFVELAVENLVRQRLDQFVDLVADTSGSSATSLHGLSRKASVGRRKSVSVAQQSVPSTPSSGLPASPSTSPLLFALQSLHSDFDLLLQTFDTFNLLTNPNKLWYKLQNYCFLHKSNLGALVCALYWQQYGPPPAAPVQLPAHLSIPTQLKPLSVTSVLLRECTALTALVSGRDFTSFATRGSLGGGPALQYHLSQMYQHLLLIRDEINRILMAQSGPAVPSTPMSPAASGGHQTPLSGRSKDLVKLEWNFLQTLIHSTLLLWSLEVRDVDALMTILDSSFANSSIRHPRLSAQSILAPVKVDTAATILPRKVKHITRNEIPRSGGYEWKVEFMMVSLTPSITRFQCVYYSSYAKCAKVLSLLQSARGDADIGYARSGTALRVGFLERDAPHAYNASHPYSNRVLWIEEAGADLSASSVADDYLANPALLKKQAAAASASASGRTVSDLEEGVKASFGEMIECVAVHRVLATFQNNLKQTQLSQMDAANFVQVGAPAPPNTGRGSAARSSFLAGEAELKNEIFEAYLSLNGALDAQLSTLNASIGAQFSRAMRQLVSAKLEFEFSDMEDHSHDGPELLRANKAARVYPLQEAIDAVFELTVSDGAAQAVATPAASTANLLHSLGLATPLKLLGQEVVRLFTLESVVAPGAKEIPFTNAPLDVYKRGGVGGSGGSGGSSKSVALPQALAVNPLDGNMLAIATSQGIREINVEHAVKFRRRDRDMQLQDDEEATWATALHRFDSVALGAQAAATATSSQPLSPPSRAQDHAENLLKLMYNTPGVTTLAYPAPKAILAALLGGTLTVGPPAATPTPTNLSGKAAALLGLVPVQSSHAASSFLQGGLARVYEGFVEAAPYKPEHAGAAVMQMQERDAPSTQLTAHPSLPMYVSVTANRVLLWHFGWPAPLAEFSTRTASHLLYSRLGVNVGGGGLGSSSERSSSKLEVITRVRFNAMGNKLAAATESGRVLLWVFAARPVGTSSLSASSSELPQLPAYDSIDGAHNRGINDLCWIAGSSAGGIGGNGNTIATAGDSTNHMNVCLWSVLLPAEDRLLCSFACHERDGGAASVVHCASSNQLVVGAAKGGALLIFSLSSMQLVRRLDTGKSARIHRLTYDPLADLLLAGTSDGAFKLWFCSSWQNAGEWSDLYSRASSFFASSGSHHHHVSLVKDGVSDILCNGTDVFVCGSDGSVKFMQKKRHYCVASEYYLPAAISASNSASKTAASLQHIGQV